MEIPVPVTVCIYIEVKESSFFLQYVKHEENACLIKGDVGRWWELLKKCYASKNVADVFVWWA